MNVGRLLLTLLATGIACALLAAIVALLVRA